MLTVTEAAGSHLSQMLSSAPDDAAIRFVPQGNSLVPQIDSPRPDDTVIQHDEKPVLVLEPPVAEALDDKTLDVRDTQEGPQLTLTEGESQA